MASSEQAALDLLAEIVGDQSSRIARLEKSVAKLATAVGQLRTMIFTTIATLIAAGGLVTWALNIAISMQSMGVSAVP